MADITDPSKIDDPGYLLNKRNTTQNYAFGKTANDYAQTMEQQRSARANDQLAYNYKRAADNKAWAGANQGFDTGGATQGRANEAYTHAKNTAYQGAFDTHTQNMYGLNQAYESMTRQKDQTLQGYDLSEAQRKSNLASSLRDVQTSAGGGAGGAGGAGAPGPVGTAVEGATYTGETKDAKGNPVYNYQADNPESPAAVDPAQQAKDEKQAQIDQNWVKWIDGQTVFVAPGTPGAYNQITKQELPTEDSYNASVQQYYLQNGL
jgi:hypothetical protein